VSPRIRDGRDADVPAIAAIYAHHVRTGLASFETEPPDEGQMRARLIEACEAIGCRQLIAMIGDSGDTASIGLHSALGFTRVGTLRSVGYKHGRWVDSVILQRAVGSGDTTLPEN
jgi:L-amino acid N-acyltransferase YncA